MAHKAWTQEELLIALRIYCELEFGQFHARNARIIEVAEAIGRTPAALAMKLGNFASLDPAMEGKGLKSVSKADKEVMAALLESPEKVIMKAEAEYSKLYAGYGNKGFEEPAIPSFEYEHITQTEITSQVKARTVQGFFRKMVISSYHFNCAVCTLNIPQLLIASHIVPWAENKDLRVNPTNGISMCAVHDKSFDRGLLALEDDCSIILSPKLKEYQNNKMVDKLFSQFENKTIHMPFRFAPSPDSIAWHRENVFIQ